MAIAPLYDDSSFPITGPIAFSAWQAECLSVNGFNSMEVPFKGFVGSNIAPSYSFEQRTRDGMYSIAEGEIGFACLAYPTVIFRFNCIDLVNTSGFLGTLTQFNTANRTYTLPDASGTIALEGSTGATSSTYVNMESFTINQGQPVKLVSGGVKLAQANGIGNVADGVAQNTTSSGGNVNVTLLGPTTLSDWSAALGVSSPDTLTQGDNYYLQPGAAGILGTTPATSTGQVFQFIGFAFTPTQLLVNLGQPILS